MYIQQLGTYYSGRLGDFWVRRPGERHIMLGNYGKYNTSFNIAECTSFILEF